ASLFVWLVLPYVSIVVFAVGHWWRYRRDQFGWTSRSTQLLESRLLAWGSTLFHYGALAVIGGHVVGILIPAHITGSVGVNEAVYHRLAGIAGGIAGIVCLVGFGILTFRRTAIRRIRVTTSLADVVVFVLLGALILLGDGATFGYNLVGQGYDYRATVGPWFRSIWVDPDPTIMNRAPVVYQVHAALPWLLYAVWPFSRLVHVWSYPLQYLGRPYILYRNRFADARR
ncbi:MAG TPA: respiratory nitrate reductase subunit gamma, partial [Gaiellaceae bacterium]|nr:respiratory nitrate reductase subunit gamma [Gaiellaceae bacterium]